MRFKLILNVQKRASSSFLPLNYQYEQASAIYKILSKADASFAEWLHTNGYQLESGKRFKLFTFSRFEISQYRIHKETKRLEILSDSIVWYISFLPEHGTAKFIQGLFTEQTLEIGDCRSTVNFQVQNIEILPPLDFSNEMTFESISPICVKFKNPDGSVTYLTPADARVNGALLCNLLSKYEAFYGKSYVGNLLFDLTPLTDPKPVLITIKAYTPQQTKVKGYLCKFKLKAPVELLKIAYESGLGDECSQGFGCLRMINK